MSSVVSPTILIVPGLRDHIDDHWQTLLARKLDKVRTVPPLEHNKLSRHARVTALNETIAEIDGPVIIVAHSAGVMITVHWAQVHHRAIHGALLAAPADLELPMPAGYPTREVLNEHGWLPVPRNQLPFPSIVAASTDDPLGRFDRIEEYARDWGSRLLNIGAAGHLNPASGFGEWLRAEALIQELL